MVTRRPGQYAAVARKRRLRGEIHRQRHDIIGHAVDLQVHRQLFRESEIVALLFIARSVANDVQRGKIAVPERQKRSSRTRSIPTRRGVVDPALLDAIVAQIGAPIDKMSSVSCGSYAMGGTDDLPLGVTLNLSRLS